MGTFGDLVLKRTDFFTDETGTHPIRGGEGYSGSKAGDPKGSKGGDSKSGDSKGGTPSTADIVAKAKESVAAYEKANPNRAGLVSNALDDKITNTHAGFEAMQKELDALDKRAPSMTAKEWHDNQYFHSPNSQMRWGSPDERPLTRQEAEMINHQRSVADSKKIGHTIPEAKAGELASPEHGKLLAEGGIWGRERTAQYERLGGGSKLK